MRIDKFLKNSRIIKRRTVAKEACEQGRITVNGKVAKPGNEVDTGDDIYKLREREPSGQGIGIEGSVPEGRRGVHV